MPTPESYVNSSFGPPHQQEPALGEERTAEDAPCICAHGEYKGDYRDEDIDLIVASIPGTYAECDPRCGKCYWAYQDFLAGGAGDW